MRNKYNTAQNFVEMTETKNARAMLELVISQIDKSTIEREFANRLIQTLSAVDSAMYQHELFLRSELNKTEES
jgi:hypothetical protein